MNKTFIRWSVILLVVLGLACGIGTAAETAQQAIKEIAIPATPPRAPKVYKLPERISQYDMAETLIKSVSANVSTATLNPQGWDLDWSDRNSVKNNAKEFFKNNSLKDELRLYSYLIGSSTDYAERILYGTMRKCDYPGQDDLIEQLKVAGFDVEKATAPIQGFGSAYWKSIYTFQRGTLTGLMYYTGQTSVPGCLNITLTDRQINGRLPFAEFSYNELFPLRPPAELIADLERFGIKNALAQDWERTREILLSTSAAAYQDTELLIHAYALVNEDDWKNDEVSAFRLLKYFLVRRISGWINSYDGYERMERGNDKSLLQLLDKSGIRYAESHYGGYDLSAPELSDLYEEYPDSYWGQYVFLKQMAGGFMDETCYYGLTAEQPIIRGKEFLKTHPDSPFSTDVMFLLGQAYETLYDHGFPLGPCNPVTEEECHKPVEGQEANRKSAIECYESVLSSPKPDKFRRFINSSLPRLKSGSKSYCNFYFPRCD